MFKNIFGFHKQLLHTYTIFYYLSVSIGNFQKPPQTTAAILFGNNAIIAVNF